MTAALEASDIARFVHAQYARLPKTGKPQTAEWTILAGVVLTTLDAPPRVIALGTGTKCLTAEQIAADTAGECLHDAHAEVCARRALRAYFVSELKSLASSSTSDVLQPIASCDCSTGPDGSTGGGRGGFELKPGVTLIFYTSEPPCGDAAIFDYESDAATAEPSAKRQCGVVEGGGAADPPLLRSHRTGARPAASDAMEAEAKMGGSICMTGLVRTKPGRGVRTSCMSCSDKLARWHALGVQGALLSLLLPQPIRFVRIVVGRPSSLVALRRAVCRCRSDGSHPRTHDDVPPTSLQLESTSMQFEHSPPADAATDSDVHDASHRPCTNSLVWGACGLSEALNGLSGKRLGANKRQPSPKHRSAVCKARVLEAWHELLALLPADVVGAAQLSETRAYSYAETKALAMAYQQRKARLLGPAGPMAEWVHAPAACEAFTALPLRLSAAPGATGAAGAGAADCQECDTALEVGRK